MTEQSRDPDDNQVLLRGLLAVEPRTRTLPSGDELCSFRLTVPRPESSYGRARSDSIDCATTRVGARRTIGRCTPGERIEVAGSLRRRFWRGAAGAPTSRYEVEVSRVRRLVTSSKPRGAATGR